MANDPLHAHSIAEIHLYLMASPCAVCDRGPLEPEQPVDGSETVVNARCKQCGRRHVFAFQLDADAPPHDRDDLLPVVNPTDEPSAIIDVGQWLTLFRVILEAAGNEPDKIESRRLGFEAAQCLEEAMKFYEDEELPPPAAAFVDSTRRRLREHPEQFARQRIAELRAKLPTSAVMQTRIARDSRPSRRPWWKFWA